MNQFLFHKLRKVDNIAVLDQPRDMLKVMDRAETDFAGNKKGSRSPIYEPRFQDFKISRFQDFKISRCQDSGLRDQDLENAAAQRKQNLENLKS